MLVLFGRKRRIVCHMQKRTPLPLAKLREVQAVDLDNLPPMIHVLVTILLTNGERICKDDSGSLFIQFHKGKLTQFKVTHSLL